jgi:hypothetical protein
MNVAYVYEDNPLFERKIENATAGLKPICKKILQRISKKNAATIADYIISMQTEINPSDHYTTLVLSSIALTPTITEGHERYCPNNPDDPACVEFLHDAGNKLPPESGPLCGQEPSDPGCFKNQDPEKYCLNHNDPTFCKTIGDICDADGFVRPEDVYCKND